jgi:Uma2 family endonuclease
MAATTTHLMTVDEFSRLPVDDGPVYHELRHGEVVAVTRAKYKHYKIQRHLRRLIEDLAPVDGLVDTEFAYRPLAEHELWVADVAYVSAEREKRIDLEGYLEGAPDLVIEVLSPSNSATEMNEKEHLCLENGAKEFWVVDPTRRIVKVSTPDGITRTWRSGQQIPLPLFGDSQLPVDAIFG